MKLFYKYSLTALSLFVFGMALYAQDVMPADTAAKKSTIPAKARRRAKVKYEEPSEYTNYSRAKIAYIQELLKSFVDAEYDLTNKNTISQIYTEIESNFKMNPEEPADTREIEQIWKDATKKVRKTSPQNPEKFRKELEKKAAAKFEVYQIGSNVTIHFRRGSKTYAVTGKYTSYDGNRVVVNFKNIPFVDITEEDKVHIDSIYSERQRAEYLSAELKKFIEERSTAITKQYNIDFQKQQVGNFKNGYVMFEGTWVTPRYVTDRLIAEEIQKDPRYSKVQTEDAMKKLSTIETTQKNAGSGDDVDMAKLEDKIRHCRAAANSCTGSIDMAQGFDNVYWGFTQDEVLAALESNNVRISPEEKYDLISSSDRQIMDVELYYDKEKKLNKVVINYNIRNYDEFLALKQSMLSQYGKDDVSDSGKITHPGDPLNWTGVYTEGRLFIKQNPKSGAVEQISMTLKEVPEDVRAARLSKKEKKNRE